MKINIIVFINAFITLMYLKQLLCSANWAKNIEKLHPAMLQVKMDNYELISLCSLMNLMQHILAISYQVIKNLMKTFTLTYSVI